MEVIRTYWNGAMLWGRNVRMQFQFGGETRNEGWALPSFSPQISGLVTLWRSVRSVQISKAYRGIPNQLSVFVGEFTVREYFCATLYSTVYSSIVYSSVKS